MPPVKVLWIQWDLNATYATKRATRAEIEEVFGNRPTIRFVARPPDRLSPY
ncbi:MAG: hypothetical protein HKP61_13500 [Dactylosporangium sp.]|nr:hypothetical protein [Dactylosporangium sp.]NNJ61929.1 hypothetical protein [Dactylosporangium sp.]